MTEKYEPSEEEMKKAEDSMYPMERHLSKVHESIAKKWEEAGVNGELHITTAQEPFTQAFEGTVGDRNIKVEYRYDNKKDKRFYRAYVDGKVYIHGEGPKPDIAEKLWLRYFNGGFVNSSPLQFEADKEFAQKQVSEYAKSFQEEKNKITEETQENKLLEDLGL